VKIERARVGNLTASKEGKQKPLDPLRWELMCNISMTLTTFLASAILFVGGSLWIIGRFALNTHFGHLPERAAHEARVLWGGPGFVLGLLCLTACIIAWIVVWRFVAVLPILAVGVTVASWWYFQTDVFPQPASQLMAGAWSLITLSLVALTLVSFRARRSIASQGSP